MIRVRALATLVALVAVCAPAARADQPPVRFSVRLGDRARLGHDTSLSLALQVDRRLPPLTEFRLLTARGIDLSTSMLGAALCRRPSVEIAEIMGPIVEHPCPGNALMGRGSASANLVLDPLEMLPGAGLVGLYSGPSERGHPGLVAIVNTYHPARMLLTYVGYLYVPPPSFGLGIALRVPPIPKPPFGAPVALSSLRLTVGGPSITYTQARNGRRVAYHPGGIPLPERCPLGGFRFRVVLRFADGSRRASDAGAPCPRAPRGSSS